MEAAVLETSKINGRPIEVCFSPQPPAPRFTYLPFGTGPRVCVGAQFAMAEGTLVLARLIQAFADDEPVRPMAIVTTAPDRVVPFRLKPRKH